MYFGIYTLPLISSMLLTSTRVCIEYQRLKIALIAVMLCLVISPSLPSHLHMFIRGQMEKAEDSWPQQSSSMFRNWEKDCSHGRCVVGKVCGEPWSNFEFAKNF